MSNPDPLARFKDKNGDWLEPDKWPKARHSVVCPNAACDTNSIHDPIMGKRYPRLLSQTIDVAERVDGTYAVQCACGSIPTITKVSPNAQLGFFDR